MNQRKSVGLFLSCALAALLTVILCAQCPDTAAGNRFKASWTVLVYLALDNDLDRHMLASVNEMEAAGAAGDVRVVVQLDTWRRKVHGSVGAKRLRIVRDSLPDRITSPVVEDLGEVDMTDPQVMSDFIIWGVKNYPARRYFLILADHGRASKGFCQDYSGRGREYHMPLGDLSAALARASRETGLDKLDLIGFDACVMAALEVDFILRDFARCRVASEDAGPIVTWPYDKILTSLNANPAMSARELGQTVCSAYLRQFPEEKVPQNLTLSLVDLSKLSPVLTALDRYGAQLGRQVKARGGLAETLRSSITTARRFGCDGDHYDSVDLKDVTKVFSEHLRAAESGEAAETLNAAIEQAVLFRVGAERLDLGGISIYLPRVKAVWRKERTLYRNLSFAKHTKWFDMIDCLHGLGQHPERETGCVSRDEE